MFKFLHKMFSFTIKMILKLMAGICFLVVGGAFIGFIYDGIVNYYFGTTILQQIFGALILGFVGLIIVGCLCIFTIVVACGRLIDARG